MIYIWLDVIQRLDGLFTYDIVNSRSHTFYEVLTDEVPQVKFNWVRGEKTVNHWKKKPKKQVALKGDRSSSTKTQSLHELSSRNESEYPFLITCQDAGKMFGIELQDVG